MSNTNLIRISLLINLLLVIAVTVLFLKKGKQNDQEVPAVAANEVPRASAFADTSKVSAPIVAFVNSQRISEEYQMLIDQNEVFTKKLRSSDNKLAKERDARQKEVDKIQVYVQNNPNISQEDLAVLEQSVYQLKMELDSLQQVESSNLQRSGEKLQTEVADKIDEFLKRYVGTKGIDYILSYDPAFRTILYGSPAYDVTDEVLLGLNKEYGETKEKENEKE
jgi:outer membrane protein